MSWCATNSASSNGELERRRAELAVLEVAHRAAPAHQWLSNPVCSSSLGFPADSRRGSHESPRQRRNLSQECTNPVGQMATSVPVRSSERRLWRLCGSLCGSKMRSPGIHSELLKLGIDVTERTVSRLLPKRRSPLSQTWRTFLINHVRNLVSNRLLHPARRSLRIRRGRAANSAFHLEPAASPCPRAHRP